MTLTQFLVLLVALGWASGFVVVFGATRGYRVLEAERNQADAQRVEALEVAVRYRAGLVDVLQATYQAQRVMEDSGAVEVRALETYGNVMETARVALDLDSEEMGELLVSVTVPRVGRKFKTTPPSAAFLDPGSRPPAQGASDA